MRLFLIAAGVAAASFLCTTAAQAQATRTWVSGVGDDVNPCSRTAPCKTFAGAISKTATGGEIDVLDPGGFGAVTITKSITIDGAGQFGSILASGVNGVVVNITTGSTNVVLRNLSINGAGTTLGLNGVNVAGGAANLQMENVQISNFSGNGVKFTPTSATTASRLLIKNSVISDAGGGAITVAPTGGLGVNVELVNVTATRSLHGLRVQDRGLADVIDSHLVGNSGAGAIATSSAAGIFSAINLKDSITSNNGTGASTSGASASIAFTNTSIFLNTTGLSAPTGQLISWGNNQLLSNGVNGAFTSTIPQL